MAEHDVDVAELVVGELAAQDDRLYRAAKMFVRLVERDMLFDCTMTEGAITIGWARGQLIEAAQRAADAYKRCEDAGLFNDLAGPDEDLEDDELEDGGE